MTCNASTFPLKVTVYKPLKGEMKDLEICEGETARIDAGSYQANTYTWTIDDGTDSIKGSRYFQDTPEQTTVYHVHMTRGGVCEKDTQVTVKVNPLPVILSIDSAGYRDVDVEMDMQSGAIHRFSIDGGDWTEDSHISGLAYSMHTIKVEDNNGCSIIDTFIVNAPEIKIPIDFSPNGDGDYDNWVVPGISETYPEAEFTIYDRWGKKLVEYLGSDGGWDGKYNGVDMPSTDYWYELVVREIDKIYTGHFTLIRR